MHRCGGRRVSRRGVEKWFERLLRLLPCNFVLNSITISGPAWNTTVIIQFTDTITPEFGQFYRNNGIQFIKLRFGKAYHIHTYVDTAKVIRALDILFQNGAVEAKAELIEE